MIDDHLDVRLLGPWLSCSVYPAFITHSVLSFTPSRQSRIDTLTTKPCPLRVDIPYEDMVKAKVDFHIWLSLTPLTALPTLLPSIFNYLPTTSQNDVFGASERHCGCCITYIWSPVTEVCLSVCLSVCLRQVLSCVATWPPVLLVSDWSSPLILLFEFRQVPIFWVIRRNEAEVDHI